jgi:hypothetical protein
MNKWKENVKMDFKERYCPRIQLAQVRGTTGVL